MKFNVPKHLYGRAKLAAMTEQAARPPLKVTHPSVPLFARRPSLVVIDDPWQPINPPPFLLHK